MAERLQGAALFVAGVTGMCASLGTRRTSHVIIRFPPSRRYLESPSPPSPLLLLPPRRHIVAEKRRQKRGVSACNQRPCSGENKNTNVACFWRSSSPPQSAISKRRHYSRTPPLQHSTVSPRVILIPHVTVTTESCLAGSTDLLAASRFV